MHAIFAVLTRQGRRRRRRPGGGSGKPNVSVGSLLSVARVACLLGRWKRRRRKRRREKKETRRVFVDEDAGRICRS
jgi:hypothetical protein